jgi:hypothetical protein
MNRSEQSQASITRSMWRDAHAKDIPHDERLEIRAQFSQTLLRSLVLGAAFQDAVDVLRHKYTPPNGVILEDRLQREEASSLNLRTDPSLYGHISQYQLNAKWPC